jgi:CheY-like chemotaxis protein
MPMAERPLIMIVDDEDAVRSALSANLIARGFDTVEAADGRKALHYLASESARPAAILVDLRMPDMTGWELVAVVKGYAALATIPIVIVSALEPDYPEALGDKIAGYIVKPVDMKALVELLSRLTKSARAPAAV